jgi:hypothetical protein
LAAVVVAVAVAVVTMTTWGTAVGGLRRYCPVEAHAVVDDQGSVFVLYFSALMIGSFFFIACCFRCRSYYSILAEHFFQCMSPNSVEENHEEQPLCER